MKYKYDMDLLKSLNEEYKSKPVVNDFPIYNHEYQFKTADQRLRSLSELLDINGKRVLEVGCGGGYVSRKLATDYDCNVIGVDIYKNDVWEELGKEKNLEYLVLDLSNGNPFKYQSFDLIISYTVWEHIFHPFKVLQECSKLIKPEGAIFMTANLYRSALSSHLYRDIYFPYPQLLFPDEVIEEYLIEIGRPTWIDHYYSVNKLTYAQYKEYFRILNLKIEYEYLNKRKLDLEFYERFEEKLGRYPIFDLELDFFHVILKIDDSNKEPVDINPLLSYEIKSNKNSPQKVGSTITWSIEAFGNQLEYAWYIYKDGERIDVIWYSTDNYMEWTPEEPGTYQIKVFIRDQLENIITDTSDEFLIKP